MADPSEAHGECRVMHRVHPFGAGHLTVSPTVGRLARQALLSTSPRQPIELTPKGRSPPRDRRARHDIVHRFLLAIGASEKAAATDPEGIEHRLTEQTPRRFRGIADRSSVNASRPSA